MLVHRLLTAIVVLLLVSVSIYLATQVLPGDAAQAILGREATPERLAALRERLHLHGDPVAQYFFWLASVIRLDFGVSLATGAPVAELLAPKIGNSLVLMAIATFVGVPFSLLVGIVTACRRDGQLDSVVTVFSLVITALPEFVVGMLLVIVFATTVWTVLPASSTASPVLAYPVQLILPSLTLVIAIAPYIMRMTQATMIEVLESDYVQHARLSGVRESTVVLRHALINIVGTVSQVIALQMAYLAGGVVVVEYVFGFPGIGTALVDAVSNRDLPVIQAICLFITTFYIVINLLADAVTAIANPRVRYANR
ncbi:MAG: ABC transporter permease [Mesorhizobium sp.]|nr:MAG: ABC transporter permease [Mesorhizobium sp.]TJW89158.1 MAG: ABC transporter permease [Mesorhizobium sp.]